MNAPIDLALAETDEAGQAAHSYNAIEWVQRVVHLCSALMGPCGFARDYVKHAG